MSKWTEYYSRPGNKERHLKQKYECDKRRIKQIKEEVDKIKNVPCKDCGLKFPPYVMDFDHLGDKIDNVSNMIGKSKSLKKVLAEIAKCEIVCSNCHRVRTHNRNLVP